MVPIVRFTLKHALSEKLESSSVCIPLAIQHAGIVFSLIRDGFQRVRIAHIQRCALVGH